jgi:hypothetical protein
MQQIPSISFILKSVLGSKTLEKPRQPAPNISR